MNNYGVLAIDLAKTVFQVCKTDSFGNVIYNKAVNRKRLKEILTLEKKSLVAMESCGGTHYWARFAKAQKKEDLDTHLFGQKRRSGHPPI